MADFAVNLAFGRIAESKISEWLQKCGNVVSDMTNTKGLPGTGPRVFTKFGALVTPDFLVAKGGRANWVEAKHKSAFTWYRKKRRWVTGIDISKYEHYRRVRDGSGIPLWLLFLQESGQAKDSAPSPYYGLFGQDLAVLEKTASHRDTLPGHPPMIYWARESLILLASLEELGIAPPPAKTQPAVQKTPDEVWNEYKAEIAKERSKCDRQLMLF